MYIHLPWYFWLTAIGALASAGGLLVWSLPARTRAGVAAFLGIWFATDIIVAAHGVFHYSAQYPRPYIAVGMLVPLLAGVLALRFSGSLRSAFDAIPQHRLIGIQALRAVGFTFVILLAQHRLPAVFAIPAGIGDILIGLEAIVVARGYSKGSKSVSTAAVVWNILGVIDLLAASSIGFLAATTPLRLIFSTPTTDAMTVLPMVMVPIFGIPLFMLLHGLSLSRIIADAKARRRSASMPNPTQYAAGDARTSR